MLMLSIFFLGCTKNEQKTEEINTFGDIEVEHFEKVVTNLEVIPSPLKMKTKVLNAGLHISLGDRIETTNLPTFDIEDKSRIAVLTGVLLTDLVITLDTAPPEDIEKILLKIKEGFAQLKTGNDIQRTIDDLISTAKKPDFDRAKYLQEVDLLSEVLIPELKSEAGTWAIPLIQAGAWLEGIYTISKVIQKEDAYVTGKKLFYHPTVASYFIHYFEEAGKEKFPNNLNSQIKEALEKLDAYDKKTELTKKEIDDVSTIVHELMKLYH